MAFYKNRRHQNSHLYMCYDHTLPERTFCVNQDEREEEFNSFDSFERSHDSSGISSEHSHGDHNYYRSEESLDNLEITAVDDDSQRTVWVEPTQETTENVVRLGPWSKNDYKHVKISSPKKGTLRLATDFQIRYVDVKKLAITKTIVNEGVEEVKDEKKVKEVDPQTDVKAKLAAVREAKKEKKVYNYSQSSEESDIESTKSSEGEFKIVDTLSSNENEETRDNKRTSLTANGEENLPSSKKRKIKLVDYYPGPTPGKVTQVKQSSNQPELRKVDAQENKVDQQTTVNHRNNRNSRERCDETEKPTKEDKLTHKDLVKFEFNMHFSLHKVATPSYKIDFCVKTAASCIRGSKQFEEYLKNRRKEVKSNFRRMNQEGKTALVLAESCLLKVCEKIQRSKDDRILTDKTFLSEVESLKSSMAAQELYEARKCNYINNVAPQLKGKTR